MSDAIKVSKDPNENWQNDHLQFARLLAEAQALGLFSGTEIADLAREMDLDNAQVEEIVDRACDAWDAVKEKV